MTQETKIYFSVSEHNSVVNIITKLILHLQLDGLHVPGLKTDLFACSLGITTNLVKIHGIHVQGDWKFAQNL